MEKELKGKIAGGMKWAGIESFANRFVTMIIGIIIARQLMPADYGLIGMLAIFLAISNTFLNSGISSALVQRKNVNQKDYSTGFYINIIMGIILYLVFYFSAPLIADYYHQPKLIKITRITTISLLINSLCIVQGAILTINLNFKVKAINSFISNIISGIIGIYMAYAGYGVWALVIPGICSGLINLVLLWHSTKWIPSFCFKKESFDALWGFGSKHLFASLIYDIYANFSTFLIGKLYHSRELGYYTRANQFAAIPNGTILGIIIKVNYPILTKFQDDNQKLLSVYSTLLRIPLFILFPVIFGFASLAVPMIDILLGEKWLPSANMLSILCFGELWTPLILINTNLLYVKGRTDVVLKLEMIKRPIAIFMILLGSLFGIYGVCVMTVLFSFISFFIDTYYTKLILNYGAIRQLKEVLPILIYCIVMSGIVIISTMFLPFSWLKLTIGIPLGILTYFSCAKLNHDKTMNTLVVNGIDKYPSLRWMQKLI